MVVRNRIASAPSTSRWSYVSERYIMDRGTMISPSCGSSTTTARLTTVPVPDRKSTRLNSSHVKISYAVFCLKKKKKKEKSRKRSQGDRRKDRHRDTGAAC